MDSKRLFDASPQRMGIVIVFPPDVTGLFNPDVHRLVRDVEDKLENVFVTFALTGGAAPDVDGAMKAARFAGCSSAVVVSSEDWLGEDGWIDPATDTLLARTEGPVDRHLAASRVVAAYNQAQEMVEIAA